MNEKFTPFMVKIGEKPQIILFVPVGLVRHFISTIEQSMKLILVAILFLSPHVGVKRGSHYAELIERESVRREIDPLLVVAIIYHESRFRSRAKSPTNDWGLMQVHVSSSMNQRYRGRERLLFNPARNIYLGMRTLDMWRKYHRRHCTGKHHWWGHYKWGGVVRSNRYAERVLRIYRRILERQKKHVVNDVI